MPTDSDPSPQTPSQLSTDLNALTKDATELHNAMHHVENSFCSALGKVDGPQPFDQPTKDKVERLNKEWLDCYIDLKTLIQDSIQVTDGCIWAVEGYEDTVLKPIREPKSTPVDNVKILDAYILTLNGRDEAAKKLIESFVKENRSLTTLCQNVQSEATRQASTVNSTTREGTIVSMDDLIKADEEIVKLGRKIQNKQDEASKLGIVHVDGEVIGQVSNSAPKESVSQISQELKTLHADINEKVRGMNDQIATARSQQTAISVIEQINNTLKSLLPNLNIVCLKVGRFANFWATLKHDTQQLRNIFQSILDDGVDEPEFILNRRINDATSDYKTLREALKNYKKAMESVRFYGCVVGQEN